MFYEMIKKKRDLWLTDPLCPVLATIKYIEDVSKTGVGLRSVQIDAVKTYLFLKIACGNKPLAKLFSSGGFTTLDVEKVRATRKAGDYLKTHPASLALLEFALQKDDAAGNVLATELAKKLTEEPETVDAEDVFDRIFNNVTYADFLFSLPMGAGKTFLMAAFMYLDLMYASQEPTNPAFAHNFIVLAPSGTKSSIIPSLRNIEDFNPAWVIPEPLATNLKKQLCFEILDAEKTSNKSNQVRDPNVQKIARYQPYQTMFGVILVTNAEKLIQDRLTKNEEMLLIRRSEEEKSAYKNELRDVIGKIPHLAILIDEAHHAASQDDADDETLLRSRVVSQWAESANGINGVLGFSGTPYLDKAKEIVLGENLSCKTTEITSTVHYYPLVSGVSDFLKRPVVVTKSGNVSSLAIVRDGLKRFFADYGDVKYSNGCVSKIAVYCGKIDRLEKEVYPEVVKLVKNLGMDPDEVILKYHGGNKEFPQPPNSQLEFEQLDKVFSKKRVVLLVQIGKEGWDCRSLTGVILAQEGDCPQKMVLQTSCRCLREVDDAEAETALVVLNAANSKHLEKQLAVQQHATLAEFQNGVKPKRTLRRYDRTGVLELPNLPFCQLVVHYGDKVIEDTSTVSDRLADLRARLKDDFRQKVITSEGDFKKLDGRHAVTHDDGTATYFATTFDAWLRLVNKEGFDMVKLSALKAESAALRSIFEAITEVDADGDRKLSGEYRQAEIREAVRLAFLPRRRLDVREEKIEKDAQLLDISYFKEHETFEVENETPYVPDQQECEKIVAEDTRGVSTREVSLQIAKLTAKIAREKADDYPSQPVIELLEQDLARLQSGAALNGHTYHYLPYRTDSAFEREFFAWAKGATELTSKKLEVYYNGDAPFTQFSIICYRTDAQGIKRSVGRYTPDFLILERDKKRKKIVKCLIVETKGELYAKDPKFIARRNYMETAFKSFQSANMPSFEYLCLEEQKDWKIRFSDIVKEFFKGV